MFGGTRQPQTLCQVKLHSACHKSSVSTSMINIVKKIFPWHLQYSEHVCTLLQPLSFHVIEPSE